MGLGRAGERRMNKIQEYIQSVIDKDEGYSAGNQ
jgi:hypothetical protein